MTTSALPRLALLLCILLMIPIMVRATNHDQLTDAEKTELRAYGVNPEVLGAKALLGRLRGGCDVNPYAALERYRSGQNVYITPRSGTGAENDFQQGINPELACRLVKFFEYAENTQGCRNIKITSAYRSAQQQANMCGGGRTGCAPAGRSCHQYGLAVDITSSCTPWMRQFLGQRNSNAPGAQFRLHFPYSGDHIQCTENPQAACSPGTQQCSGTFRIQANLNYTTPTQNAANMLRNFFNPQPQQPFQQPRPLQMQPLPIQQQQQLLDAFMPQMPMPAPQMQPTTGVPGTSASSAAQILEDLAFGEDPKKPDTRPGTTAPVVITASDAAMLVGTPKEDTVASTTPYFPTSVPTEGTFTTGDLAWEEAPKNENLTMLTQMRATLEILMAYLKPFGRPLPEGHTEHVYD